MGFRERFERLDPEVWTDAYLPAWSSRTAAAATYAVGDDGLVLSIPAEQPLWCPGLHPTPLRVSGIHSANRSGPVGSTDAQQPFGDHLVVREQQPTMLGMVPHFGRIAVTCAAQITGRSMFSAWMVGLEDRPDRCGEICLVEVFGETIDGGTVSVGQGVHRFRDPAVREDFSAPARQLDISRLHTYEIDWSPVGVRFAIDGAVTRTTEQSPNYPMMIILGLFDFPDRPGGAETPYLRVTEVIGTGLGSGSLGRR